MDGDGITTLLGREELPGKLKNQRFLNIICLFLGFSILFSLSWLVMMNSNLNNQTIGILTCFPGTLFALLIAEFFSRLIDR